MRIYEDQSLQPEADAIRAMAAAVAAGKHVELAKWNSHGRWLCAWVEVGHNCYHLIGSRDSEGEMLRLVAEAESSGRL